MHDTQLFLETTRDKDPRTWRRLARTNEEWLQYRMDQDGPLSPADVKSIREVADDLSDEEPIDFDDPLL